jgi:protease-4
MRRLTLPVVLFASMMSFLLAAAPASAAPATEPAEGGKPIIAVFEPQGTPLESPSQELMLFGQKPTSMRDLVRRLRAASVDENVKAIVFSCDELSAGPAQIEEIRTALSKARDKGKDVYVHSDSMRMGHYILASAAKRISVVPNGMLIVNGLHGEGVYLRGLLDKLGVKPEVIHVGAYKSAGEIFMREAPSAEAEEMINWLFDSMYGNLVGMVADGRKVDAAKVNEWFDAGLYTSEQAKEAGLIDAVETRAQFDTMLKKKYGENLTYERKYGVERDPQLDFSSPFAMFKIIGEMFGGKPKSQEPSKPGIGIIYVDGMILNGRGRASIFGSSGAWSTDIAKAIDEAARDETIKAVVLRVASPGGSATASEVILEASARLKQKKPLVVSMGDVAGSGGYYVAMGSDTIFADATSITGSIGVLSGKFMTTEMWKKIGINFKSFNRGKNANLLASDSVWTDEQRKQMEGLLNRFYDTFKKHVVEGRGSKLKKPLDDLAGGRVFTGKQAVELGLVDKIGTMQDAIEFAATRANLKDYDVRVVPEPRNLLERLMEDASGDEKDNRWITAQSGSLAEMAMPFLTDMDPARVRMIRAGLNQLQLLGQEGVLMAMPELLIEQ